MVDITTATGRTRAGLAAGGQLCWVSVEIRDLLAGTRDLLDLSPVATAAGELDVAAAAGYAWNLQCLRDDGTVCLQW